ncbi:MAG: hypothetical protein KJ725_14865 [Gammaproteobacteria bacterium]|uniref:hypothetical protein n=1 Tax=Methylotuvimicrobium sp. TaxID=2822413 RepID=UPI001D8044D8|nr:hypothetical protein [Gammaproteobacteria bacterium]
MPDTNLSYALNSYHHSMKKVTIENYRTDKFYLRIVKATAELLTEQGYVAPVRLFQKMELLTEQDIAAWRRGRLPYLEQAIRCNLAQASRILRILRFHAHDLNLKPSSTVYLSKQPENRIPLKFTRYGDKKREEAYATHLVSPRLKAAKERA